MPKRPSRGVTPKLIELPDDLIAQVEAFRQGRNQHFREVVIEALRRHLMFPSNPPAPPPPLEPFPSVGQEAEPPPAKRRKKAKE